MKSQKYNKDELYPEDFTEDDKLEFDMLFEQSKMLFPKLANDDWLIKKGIFAYMRKIKREMLNHHHKKKSLKLEINTQKTLFFIQMQHLLKTMLCHS